MTKSYLLSIYLLIKYIFACTKSVKVLFFILKCSEKINKIHFQKTGGRRKLGKGPFVPGANSNRDKRRPFIPVANCTRDKRPPPFYPGSWWHPG